MNEFIDFIGFVNQQLNGRGILRLETMLMPANFSSIVGEFNDIDYSEVLPCVGEE